MSEAELKQRLAAILAADVAGYSRLMAIDERATVAALDEARGIFKLQIEAHQGRVVDMAGDSVLAVFETAAGAVSAALAIQKDLHTSTDRDLTDKHMRFRIGVHLGDVIEKRDGTVYGDGVNIAARLEGLAAPGGVTVSESIYVAVRGKLGADFVDQGQQQVKNIAYPVRAFAVHTQAGGVVPVPAPGKVELLLPDRPSIAVLPFANMGSDVEQEYFADGIVEDVITALSRMRWLLVIARNSSFTYKGKSPDIRQVARELGVRYVLEGSLRRSGDRVRVSVQLIDGISGNHLWAERYDRDVVDIFAVQDDITRKVVSAIEPQLYAAENLRIQTRPPESLDAWGCVIRALWYLGHFTKDDNDQALRLLRQAVTLSPQYAKAHSVLAFAESRAVFFGSDIESGLASWREIVRTARALDEDDPWSYFSSGYIECFDGRYEDAIAWYRRAIDLNENFALAHGNMAAALAFGGHPDAAIEAVNRALLMSPRDPFNFSYLHYAAIAYFSAERYAEGVASEERALRERPNVTTAMRFLAACKLGLGQIHEARAIIAESLRLAPESSIKRCVYGQGGAYARESDRERYATALRKAGLPEE